MQTRRRLVAGSLGAAVAAACVPGNEPPRRPGRAGPPRDDPSTAPVSVEGRLLFVGDANIWAWARGALRQLTTDRVSRQPSWSPDGKQIVHVKLSPSASEIWIMDADGGSSRQLTRYEQRDVRRSRWAFRPVFRPDGGGIYFLTDEASHDLWLWQMGLDGRFRQPVVRLFDQQAGVDMPSFASDSKRVALATYRTGQSQVWVYNLLSATWKQLTEEPDGAYDPAWSPDGTRIAYAGRRQGRHDIWIIPAEGGPPMQVTRNGVSRSPAWSPDGRATAYVSAQSGGFEVWATALPPVALSGSAGSAGVAATNTPSPTGTRAGDPLALQLTKGALVDATSGLAWSR